MSILMFTIGDIAKLAGVTPKTIRHYHHIGLLAEPTRDTNNYRLYSIEQLEQIQQIVRLKNLGLSLKQIKAILDSDNPDGLIKIVLRQHHRRIENEIVKLQAQQENIEAFLQSDDVSLDEWGQDSPKYSAMTVVSDAIKPQSNGLSDVLIEVESHVLNQIDRYEWDAGYELFWHTVGQNLFTKLKRNESLLIFWLERYIALGDMAQDDLQAQAWLAEFKQSPAPLFIAHTLDLPQTALLPDTEQQHIRKLIPALLFQQGSTLQRQFLHMIFSR